MTTLTARATDKIAREPGAKISETVNYVAHASKLGRLYSDLAKEAFRPYQSLVANVTAPK